MRRRGRRFFLCEKVILGVCSDFRGENRHAYVKFKEGNLYWKANKCLYFFQKMAVVP